MIELSPWQKREALGEQQLTSRTAARIRSRIRRKIAERRLADALPGYTAFRSRRSDPRRAGGSRTRGDEYPAGIGLHKDCRHACRDRLLYPPAAAGGVRDVWIFAIPGGGGGLRDRRHLCQRSVWHGAGQ